MKVSNTQFLIGFILLLLAVVAVAIMGRRKHNAKVRQLQELDKLIDGDIGADGEDATSILHNVKPDTRYNAAKDAEILQKANTTPDDHTAVFTVLKGKTKAQLATLNKALLQMSGKSLDQFLKDILMDFSDRSWLDWSKYPDYERALAMMKAAS
jgi:hypothetical protein